MNKLLKYLDGAKTYAGIALLGIAYIGLYVAPDLQAVWNGAQQLGLILTGAGLGHKATKLSQ